MLRSRQFDEFSSGEINECDGHNAAKRQATANTSQQVNSCRHTSVETLLTVILVPADSLIRAMCLRNSGPCAS